MKKLLFYSNTKIKGEIYFKKLGIKIRPLQEDEKCNLKSLYKELLLNKQYIELAKKFGDIRKNGNNYTIEEKNKVYSKMSSLEIKNSFANKVIWNLYYNILEEDYSVLNLRYINHCINKVYIIEIDLNIFTKQFEEKYIYILFPKILNFSNYLSDYNYDIDKSGIDILLFETDKIFEKSNEYNMKLLGFLLKEKGKNSEFNIYYLKKLQVMLNKYDANFCFNFVTIIDAMFSNENLLENSIINKVSFLERLLITKDEKKQENFILKVGILCHGLSDISNENLSLQLKEIYNIRSMIVHGTELKIIDNIEYYKKVFGNLINKDTNKFKTKQNILLVVDALLELYFMKVLKTYMDNTDLCNYIKFN